MEEGFYREVNVVLMTPRDLYDILFEHFGPQHWWPGDSPFETAIGAILTQNTAWTNVERTIRNLKEADCFSVEEIAAAQNLEELIRPAGYFNQKAGYLRNFCQHIIGHHSSSIEEMLDGNLNDVRKELLTIRGIGPETADSILLYAGNHPTFVVDAYTIRIGNRIGLFSTETYHEVKEFFEAGMKPDPQIYNEYHALLVALGKRVCKARDPGCQECPVRESCQFAISK